jgi:putative ABC transport system substrate-binding protein
LQALGWVEGKNLIIEYRYGEGRDERYPEFAAELVSMPVDVLVVWGSPAAFAAKHATTTIPILIGSAGDVVNTGLVSNLARPDANLTGFIALNVDLEGKRLELLKEAIPRLSRVAVLANPANPISRLNMDIARQAAEKLGVKVEIVEAKSGDEVDGALAQIKQLHPDAALLASDTQLLSKRKEIVEFHGSREYSRDLSVSGICERRRIVHLRSQYFGSLRAGRRLPGQASQRREGQQLARPAGHHF